MIKFLKDGGPPIFIFFDDQKNLPGNGILEKLDEIGTGNLIVNEDSLHKNFEKSWLVTFIGSNLDRDIESMIGKPYIISGNGFMIGRSTRTNDIGIQELSEIASSFGYPVQIIDVPHSTLHLTTVCSVPSNGILVAAEGHLKPEQIHGFDEIIWVPNEETYASNTIAMENGLVLVSAGFPITKQRLEDAGFQTKDVEMGEIMQADGSLTCLSLFIG